MGKNRGQNRILNLKLQESFFTNDVITVAPKLLGKNIVRKLGNTDIKKFLITEVEAYRGEEDLACHASKGRTNRTEVMYWKGGFVYVYLIYGIHYMLNFVTGEVNNPQAVLIRGVEDISGPGRVGKALEIDKGFNKVSLLNSDTIWVEETNFQPKYKCLPRVGIDYAGEYWKNMPWRFIISK